MTFSAGIDPSAPTTRKSNRRRGQGSLWSKELHHIRDVSITIAITIVISVLIRQFLFGIYLIPSESMSPTTEVGDRIGVSMFAPEIEPIRRGDVIVFSDPGGWLPAEASEQKSSGLVIDAFRFIGVLPADNRNLVIKRVIGLPGERIVCCTLEGKLTVDGAPIDEPYIEMPGEPILFDVNVPADHLWVMGDNRGNSADSRLQPTPFVPIGNIVGRVNSVIWPLDRVAVLPRY